ncbi:sensor histidine kinase [Streptomyces sp. 7N604]|uniref:sensor histidine kinase n=1 Tax=Streptomyces sp. 7N604 TaxID=3457415 RepID=UPI003FD61050
MSRLTRWWDRRSDPARIELYTRWLFHAFVLVEITAIGAAVAGGEAPARVRAGLFLLVAVHAVLCAVLSSRSLDWALDRRARPVRLATGVAVFSAAGAVLALSLRAAGTVPEIGDASSAVVGFTGFGLGALVLGLRGIRHALYAAGVAAAGVAVAAAAVRLPVNEVVGFAVATALAGTVMTFTNGFSAWLLRAVWELDAARELQARLAVAEERLRFGRDLHDVMGRNLSVIALKSELAVQLARRGRPEAVEQMIEVQRIAQESQREVRDVVRGYREADLDVELAGARSVLRAAGVACRVEGDDGSRLPTEVQSALGWVVREAATNVLRHGDARRCAIRLDAGAGGAGRAVLVVENDGAPGTAPGRGGAGLAGLRERLTALGGTLAAGPHPDGTFRLTAEIPLPGGVSDFLPALRAGASRLPAPEGGSALQPDRRPGRKAPRVPEPHIVRSREGAPAGGAARGHCGEGPSAGLAPGRAGGEAGDWEERAEGLPAESAGDSRRHRGRSSGRGPAGA